MTIRHWMRLGLLCRTLVRRNVHLRSGAVLEQNRLLYMYKGWFGARQIIMRVYYICINIFTRFLCMHKILVHAQHSCAVPGLGPAQLPFWVPGLVHGPWLGPWPLGPSACTRVLCMHKSVVHAQESCACTRSLVQCRCALFCF